MPHHDQLFHVIPSPASHITMLRWEETRRRRRLMSGEWLPDLTVRLRDQIGTIRSGGWGRPKITTNLFATIQREQSALYSREPNVRTGDGMPAPDILASAVRESGLWSRGSEFQAYVLALREAFWRMDVTPAGELTYRPVWPDLVEAEANAVRPDQPTMLRELRWRDDWGWCWDAFDLLGPRGPSFKILRHNNEADITVDVLGQTCEGDEYPYRYADGIPFLPYTIYHARSLGDRLWHERDQIEVAEASLEVAIGHSMLSHVMTDASWPQRYIMGCSLSGGEMTATGSRREIVADPAVIWELIPSPNFSGQPTVGQFAVAADIGAMADVISQMTDRIAIEAGLPPGESQRHSAQSGYAISLSNEGKRTAARRFAPSFKASDEELMAKTAALLNRTLGTNLPEAGYTVLYQDLPLSPEELRSRRENLLSLLSSGLISKTSAYMELHPGISREQATAELEAIAAESVPATQSGYLVGHVSEAGALARSVYTGEIAASQAQSILTSMIGVSPEEAPRIAPSGITSPPPKE